MNISGRVSKREVGFNEVAAPIDNRSKINNINLSHDHLKDASITVLTELQKLLQHGETFGTWTTPAQWMPPTMNRPFQLSVDLRLRILSYLPPDLNLSNPNLGIALWIAIVELMRYLLILRTVPVGLGRKAKNRSLDVTSISLVAHAAGPAIYAAAIMKYVRSGSTAIFDNIPKLSRILSFISVNDIIISSDSLTNLCRKECQRMTMLAERGMWNDCPQRDDFKRSNLISGPALKNEIPKERQPHLPLPDQYVAEMARHSIVLFRDIGPNIIRILERFSKASKNYENDGGSVRTRREFETSRILSGHVWEDHQGNKIKELPITFFTINSDENLQAEDAFFRTIHWPPDNFQELSGWLGLVQMAHYFIIALSTGARASETLSLKRTCIRRQPDGRTYATGRTFKLVQAYDGEEKDWLLPDLAVSAIEQQAKLIDLAEKLRFWKNTKLGKDLLPFSDPEPQHLWGQLSYSYTSNAFRPFRVINQYLQRYAALLGMSINPSGQNIRSHRFRKTLARLVALALTQAPKILMDIFGHKSIEMVLHYVLTDKVLRAEIETVSRELRVMRAKTVVSEMVEAMQKPNSFKEYGGYGGLGAVSINNAVRGYQERVHRRGEDWSETKAYELAELLTIQGTSWEQVRAGIMCTKLPGEAGPCTKRTGRPMPDRCESTCSHRLEDAFLREDVDSAIRASIENYERAISDSEGLTAAHWASQIRTHVRRFADLEGKWMSNATVRKLIDSRTTGNLS